MNIILKNQGNKQVMFFYYRARVEYNGANYSGWQVQPNLPSVQQTIKDVFVRLCGTSDNVKVVGSSRTDTGVHALDQVIGITLPKHFAPEKLLHSINSMLPEDIKINLLEECEAEFHPIHFIKQKQYFYAFQEEKWASVFTRPLVFSVKNALNLELMNQAAQLFLGEHDFIYYRSEGTPNKTTVRTVFESQVFRPGIGPFFSLTPAPGILLFSVQANGFLRQMVRSMAGILHAVGRGAVTLDQVAETLGPNSAKLKKLAPVLPGNALFLYSSWPKF